MSRHELSPTERIDMESITRPFVRPAADAPAEADWSDPDHDDEPAAGQVLPAPRWGIALRYPGGQVIEMLPFTSVSRPAAEEAARMLRQVLDLASEFPLLDHLTDVAPEWMVDAARDIVAAGRNPSFYVPVVCDLSRGDNAAYHLLRAA